jgi:flagellar biosynthesis/type III secretory pathway M-ring protein FliF/YscJ
MPFGYGLWVWFRNNPAAQVAAAVVAGIVVFFGWLGLHDQRVRRESRLKAEIKAEKQATKAIKEVKERTDETVQKATEARAAVPDGALADELPDDLQSILFND